MNSNNGFRFAQRIGNIMGVVFHCPCCNSLSPFKLNVGVAGEQRIQCTVCVRKDLVVRGVLVAMGDDIPNYRVEQTTVARPAEIRLDRVPRALHAMAPANEVRRVLGLTG